MKFRNQKEDEELETRDESVFCLVIVNGYLGIMPGELRHADVSLNSEVRDVSH